jgi:hypothetical protein
MLLVEVMPAVVEAIHHAMTFAIEIEIATGIVTGTFAMDHHSAEMIAIEIGLVETV